jgi:lantibiotic leader peptide-processing serine protease
MREKRRAVRRGRRSLFGVAVVLCFIAVIQTASAGTSAVIDGATAAGLCTTSYPGTTGPDQLSPCQWDMRVIGSNAAHETETGDGVKVGIIDSGIDFTHPDLAGGIDTALSCSFIFGTTPTAAPAEVANGNCANKPAVQDLNGHGTHVATTVAARENGIGIVGVAPEATIVGLKACTIVGFCFADSVAAALRYAGDQELDVVNLSLFADPYLYYCSNEAGQRAILRDLASAARYAQQRGVVIVASAGNEADDLGHPTEDDISPDWPPDTAEENRRVRNNCRVAPAELTGVVTVSATGVNTLASYSNVGSPVDVTAPGGDAAQTPTTVFGRGRILAGWSSTDQTGTWEALANVNRAIVSGGGRYVWISGTSMSSPHAAGVAALIRGQHPNMPQGAVAAKIRSSATPLACPEDWPEDDERQCTGGAGQTSFFGAGMVNAANAVS